MSGSTALFGIAQLTTPADAISAPAAGIIVMPDWPRGLLYYIAGANNGGMRRYAWALATQTPQLSVPASPGFVDGVLFAADVDPVSGHVIGQWAQPTLTPNGNPIYKVDRTTFAVLGSYGVYTSGPSYPTSFWGGQQIVCLECNGVGYAILKESAFSGAFDVFRVSGTMNHAGFQGSLTGATDNRCVMTRATSGPTGGAIFATWQGLQYSATVPLYTIRIAPGAETYNPATWPATNPHISDATIGTIAASAVDSAWTQMAVVSIGYDNADGNVLMIVDTTGVAGAVQHLIKVSGTTAAVLWSTPMPNDSPQLWSYNINGGEVGFLGPGHKDAIDMATGAIATQSLSGVTLNSWGNPASTAIWDREHGWYFIRAAPYTQGAGTPTPVSGTPSSFSDFAIMGIVPAAPGLTPKLSLLRQPELHLIGPVGTVVP